MLRIIVKPVFFGIGCGENQVVFRKMECEWKSQW